MATASRPRRGTNAGGGRARTPAQNVKHVVKTWLPPGISVDDAKDPGSQQRKRARRKTP